MASIKSCYTTFRKSSAIILFLSGLNGVIAQTNTISPYSRYGLGEINEGSFSRNFGMGGIGNALQSPANANPTNPASYSRILWTNFEFAAIAKNYSLESGVQHQRANKTHLDHFSLAFPVTAWWGMGVGMKPFSEVGYEYQSSQRLTTANSDIPYIKKFTGSGGLNRVFMGHGFKPVEDLCVGLNFSYVFGDMDYQEEIRFTEDADILNTMSISSSYTGGIYFDFGAQYSVELKNKWKMILGLTANPTQGLQSKLSEYSFTFSSRNSSSFKLIDTVYFTDKRPFSIVLPPKYGIGVLFIHSDKLSAGFDADYTRWSQSNYNVRNGLEDVLSVKAGGEYVGPESRYKLRLGMRYAKLPFRISGIQPDDMAIMAGFAFPFRTKDKLNITEMNLGLEIGQRGTNRESLVLERYVNVHVALIINNKWFLKRKFD